MSFENYLSEIFGIGKPKAKPTVEDVYRVIYIEGFDYNGRIIRKKLVNRLGISEEMATKIESAIYDAAKIVFDKHKEELVVHPKDGRKPYSLAAVDYPGCEGNFANICWNAFLLPSAEEDLKKEIQDLALPKIQEILDKIS